jgi:hypothetical protein
MSLRSGRRTERDKKIEKKRLCFIWLPTGNSNTTTNQKHTHVMQAVNVRRSDRGGARGERDSIVGGDQVGRGGYNIKINHHICLKIIKLLSSPGICATHDGLPVVPVKFHSDELYAEPSPEVWSKVKKEKT